MVAGFEHGPPDPGHRSDAASRIGKGDEESAPGCQASSQQVQQQSRLHHMLEDIDHHDQVGLEGLRQIFQIGLGRDPPCPFYPRAVAWTCFNRFHHPAPVACCSQQMPGSRADLQKPPGGQMAEKAVPGLEIRLAIARDTDGFLDESPVFEGRRMKLREPVRADVFQIGTAGSTQEESPLRPTAPGSRIAARAEWAGSVAHRLDLFMREALGPSCVVLLLSARSSIHRNRADGSK
jgi:hypothetical protein